MGMNERYISLVKLGLAEQKTHKQLDEPSVFGVSPEVVQALE
jgi:hypothetical protein